MQETSSGGARLHGVHVWSWDREKGVERASGRSWELNGDTASYEGEQ